MRCDSLRKRHGHHRSGDSSDGLLVHLVMVKLRLLLRHGNNLGLSRFLGARHGC